MIKNLTESNLIPSKSAFKKYTAKQLSEILYLHIIALRILYTEDITYSFATGYAFKSARYEFDHWLPNSTDLYFCVYGLVSEEVDLKMPDTSMEFKETLYLDTKYLRNWLIKLSRKQESNSYTKRLLMSLDAQLKIKDSQMKALRRLVQDWEHLSKRQQQLSMTRLLQMMRFRCNHSDVIKKLELVANHYGLELTNVDNPDTGDVADENSIPKPKTFAKHAAAFAAGAIGGYLGTRALVKEEDGVPATTSADIAQANSILNKLEKRNKDK